MTIAKQTALITGASSGLGREFARLFAAAGYDIVLVARRRQELDALAAELPPRHGIRARVLVEDLADPMAPSRIFDHLKSEDVQISMLVNNAGFGEKGSFAVLGEKRQMDMLQVNIAALTHLTRLFLPGMLGRRQGRILNVASTAAFLPGPNMAVYFATKAFVLSFSEAIAEEVRGGGVTVTCLCPGPTETGFAAAAHMEDSLLFKLGTMKAAEVAEAGFDGMMQGRRLIVPGWKNKISAASVRFSPRGLVLRLMKRLQQ